MRRKIIQVLKSIGYHFNDRDNEISVIRRLHEEAVEESLEFVRERIDGAALFWDAPELRRYVIDKAVSGPLRDELFMEFGVFRGRTLKVFAERMKAGQSNQTIYGFDAFEGLRDHWSNINYPSGAFNLRGKTPRVPDNAELVVGWVEDTLEAFLRRHAKKKVAFLHIDMDVYPPTAFVLRKTRQICVPGTIILFDEFHGYPGWKNYEYKAFLENYDEDAFEYIGFSKMQCAIKIK